MATTTAPLAGRLSVDELTKTLEFQRLAVQQRLFVATVAAHFISTGTLDPQFAAALAYDTENARVFAYGLMGNPRVRAALDRFFGITERESFLNQLQKRIEAGTMSIADWKAARLLCTLRGWAAPDSPSEEATESDNSESVYRVGQIVSQNDHTYRVTSVDADGHITAAEPVTES
jgi:hypothetical protein